MKQMQQLLENLSETTYFLIVFHSLCFLKLIFMSALLLLKGHRIRNNLKNESELKSNGESLQMNCM